MILFLIIVVIALVVLSKAFNSPKCSISSDALKMMQDVYAGLSEEQKYSIYNLASIFVECAKGDYTKFREAKKIQNLTKMSLKINTIVAYQYFQRTGIERMISDLKTIDDEAIKDNILIACYGLVSLANGTLNGYDVQASAGNMFMNVFIEMGYTENDIDNIVKRNQAMMNYFGNYQQKRNI